LNLEKAEEEAKMSKKLKTQKELQEMDKLFEELGIEVPKEETKEFKKKNRRRKKKNKQNEGGEEVEEPKKEDAKQEENKTDEPKGDAKQEENKTDEAKKDIQGPEVPQDPEAKEAAIKEALNKRFNKPSKKGKKTDDALLIAKKEAMNRANKKKKNATKNKKMGYDL
jgi:hypothetical protein